MEAFAPVTATINLPVTATTANVSLRSLSPVVNQPVVRLANVGTQTIFVNFGIAGVTATTTAGFPMIANSVGCFSIPVTATHIAAIASAVGSTLYATVGAGQ